MLVINAGIGNKTAASLGASLTAEEYCIALSTTGIVFRGRPAPKVSQEQQEFCDTVKVSKRKGEKTE
jgi:hypothetical protein